MSCFYGDYWCCRKVGLDLVEGLDWDFGGCCSGLAPLLVLLHRREFLQLDR